MAGLQHFRSSRTFNFILLLTTRRFYRESAHFTIEILLTPTALLAAERKRLQLVSGMPRAFRGRGGGAVGVGGHTHLCSAPADPKRDTPLLWPP